MYIRPTRLIKLQFPLFLATVLTNKLVILTILFLQCGVVLTSVIFFVYTQIRNSFTVK